MSPVQMELLAYEQQQTLHQAAEQHRLLKTVRGQQANQQTIIWPIRHWLGAQLVTWGCKLQGRRVTVLPPLLNRESCCG